MGRTDLRNNPTFSNFPGVVWTLTKSNVQYQPGNFIPSHDNRPFSCKNDFDLHKNETACRTHLHMRGIQPITGTDLGIGQRRALSIRQKIPVAISGTAFFGITRGQPCEVISAPLDFPSGILG